MGNMSQPGRSIDISGAAVSSSLVANVEFNVPVEQLFCHFSWITIDAAVKVELFAMCKASELREEEDGNEYVWVICRATSSPPPPSSLLRSCHLSWNLYPALLFYFFYLIMNASPAFFHADGERKRMCSIHGQDQKSQISFSLCPFRLHHQSDTKERQNTFYSLLFFIKLRIKRNENGYIKGNPKRKYVYKNEKGRWKKSLFV